MDDFIQKLTGKLFSIIISGVFLWIVLQIGISGVKGIYNSLSGNKTKEIVFQEYSKKLQEEMNIQELEDSDILKITNHYNRKANNKFKEVGYSIILEDFYVLNMKYKEDISDIFLNNKVKINNLIETLSKEEPFNNLPQKDRIVLKNLDSAIKIKNIEWIENHFKDLEQVLEQRYAEYQRIDKESSINLIIAFISILISIISLILPAVGKENLLKFIKKIFANAKKEEDKDTASVQVRIDNK